jgi:hypothetical protein
MIMRINIKIQTIMILIIKTRYARSVPILLNINGGSAYCKIYAKLTLHKWRTIPSETPRKPSFVKTFQQPKNGLLAMLNKGRSQS